jgi:hypothetical protein
MCVTVDWTHLASDMVQCRCLVNMVMNFGFHEGGEFLEQRNNYQLCAVKLVQIYCYVATEYTRFWVFTAVKREFEVL